MTFASLYIMRHPHKRTHLFIPTGGVAVVTADLHPIAMCGTRLDHADTYGDRAIGISLAGGATTRLANELDFYFNDETCCKRCTRIAYAILLCHITRDSGRR